MGWNSWNTFRLEINEDLVRDIADMFVERGFKDAGYEYIVIDDGWQIDRDAKGNIIVNKKLRPFKGPQVWDLFGCGLQNLWRLSGQPWL
jgi:alpha-galactosidase